MSASNLGVENLVFFLFLPAYFTWVGRERDAALRFFMGCAQAIAVTAHGEFLSNGLHKSITLSGSLGASTRLSFQVTFFTYPSHHFILSLK